MNLPITRYRDFLRVAFPLAPDACIESTEYLHGKDLHFSICFLIYHLRLGPRSFRGWQLLKAPLE